MGDVKKSLMLGDFGDYIMGEKTIKGLEEETCIDRCIYKGKKLLKRERKVKK